MESYILFVFIRQSLVYYNGYFKAHMNGDEYISVNDFFRNVINYNPYDKNGDFV